MKQNLVILFLLLVIARFDARTQSQDFQYQVQSGSRSVLITGYFGPGGNITIPSAIGGMPVTGISSEAFVNRTSVTSITIPGTVTAIDALNSPFRSCSGLTNITVDPSNPAYSSLDGVLFNKNRSTIFQFPCGRSGGYIIPSSVTAIGYFAYSAFVNCSNLTSVSIPNSVTTLSYSTFSSCTSLTNVTIGSGVTTITSWAFGNCSGLTSITIPNSVTNIEDNVFYNCRSLTSVTIPNSVTTIGNSAFSGCTGLTQIYFQGNAPVTGTETFTNTPATAYYLPGTSGWGTTFAGRPTAPWFLANPMILSGSAAPGVRSNAFGFTISWATNTAVVVEASVDLANPVWTPVNTNTLVNGTNYFSDPGWNNYGSRFYRVRPQ